MTRRARHLLWFVGAVVVAAPLSVATTLLLLPLWSWFEASAGIESVGHSGPAGWCYGAVFALFVAGAAVLVLVRGCGSRGADDGT